MTNEEKRIAIAEACGWEPISADRFSTTERIAYGDKWWRHPVEKTVAALGHLPDYLNDLNAMHEAEKSLNLPQCERYWDELLTMCGPSRMIHASASVRADAFLKTIGKLP